MPSDADIWNALEPVGCAPERVRLSPEPVRCAPERVRNNLEPVRNASEPVRNQLEPVFCGLQNGKCLILSRLSIRDTLLARYSRFSFGLFPPESRNPNPAFGLSYSIFKKRPRAYHVRARRANNSWNVLQWPCQAGAGDEAARQQPCALSVTFIFSVSPHSHGEISTCHFW